MYHIYSQTLGSQTGFRPPQRWGPVCGTGGNESGSLMSWSWIQDSISRARFSREIRLGRPSFSVKKKKKVQLIDKYFTFHFHTCLYLFRFRYVMSLSVTTLSLFLWGHRVVAGANPSWLWTRAGYSLDKSPAHHRILTDGRAHHARSQLHIRSNLGFSILLKDTSTCSSAFWSPADLLYLLSYSCPRFRYLTWKLTFTDAFSWLSLRWDYWNTLAHTLVQTLSMF